MRRAVCTQCLVIPCRVGALSFGLVAASFQVSAVVVAAVATTAVCLPKVVHARVCQLRTHNHSFSDTSGAAESEQRFCREKLDLTLSSGMCFHRRCSSCGGTPAASTCASCRRVSYCSPRCQKQHWKQGGHRRACREHTQFLAKIVEIRAGLAVQEDCASADAACQGDADAAPEAPAQANLPTFGATCTNKEHQPGDDYAAMKNGTAIAVRCAKRLRGDWQTHGARIAGWWHGKTALARSAVLCAVSANSMPASMPRPENVARRARLSTSSQPAQAFALFEYSQDILGSGATCGCKPTGGDTNTCAEHVYRDRLLHEIWVRSCAGESEASWRHLHAKDRTMAEGFVENGVFPRRYGGEFVFEHDGEIMTAGTTAEAQASVKRMQERFGLQCLEIEWYTACRLYVSLVLLALVVDDFFEAELGTPHPSPAPRMGGCRECGKDCAGNTAVQCKTCEVTWFCSFACQGASGHTDESCPIGRAQSSTLYVKTTVLCCPGLPAQLPTSLACCHTVSLVGDFIRCRCCCFDHGRSDLAPQLNGGAWQSACACGHGWSTVCRTGSGLTFELMLEFHLCAVGAVLERGVLLVEHVSPPKKKALKGISFLA